MSGTLILVGTPIGNLSDLSPRAEEALRSCDFIAAEDTRVTLTLLNRFGIKKPLISYHEHNRRESGPRIVQRLLSGETAALVTDAGMPAISDPGEELVALCREADVPVTVCPGPTAVTTALALSGLPTRRFVFEGFLPADKRERRERLALLANEPRTVVLYEAPHRLETTVRELLDALGDRPLSLSRELTKLHEETQLTTLSEVLARFPVQPPRGEYVLVIGGAPVSEAAATPEDGAALAKRYQAEGLSASEAAKKAAAECKLKKGDIYRLLIAEKETVS